MAHALRSLSQAARGVAANSEEPHVLGAVLDCAGDVMDKASNLIEEARKAVAKPGDAESQQRLAQVSCGARQGLLCLSITLSLLAGGWEEPSDLLLW